MRYHEHIYQHLLRLACCMLVPALLAPLRGACQEEALMVTYKKVVFTNQTRASALATLGEITGLRFSGDETVQNNDEPVTMTLLNFTLKAILDTLFKGQPLIYKFTSSNYVSVEAAPHQKTRMNDTASAADGSVEGIVTDINHKPIAAASVGIKGIARGAATDSEGHFLIKHVRRPVTLHITRINYFPADYTVTTQTQVNIQLTPDVNSLDTVRVTYGSPVARKYATGNISPLPLNQVNKSTVSTVGAAMSGRITGLLVNDMNGIAGSLFKVQLRGQSLLSLLPGNANLPSCNPLFIVNNVPLAANNETVSRLKSASGDPSTNASLAGGMSPLYFFDMNDVESFEALKDADATAIYGSRGANGVILINTYRGKAGPMKVIVDMHSGWGTPINTVSLLNGPDYLAMRHEALNNDGIAPNAVNAPDIMVFDTTQFTDFKKTFAGRTPHISGLHVSLFGGNSRFNYHASTSLRKETLAFSNDLYSTRFYTSGSCSYTSLTKRFTATAVFVGASSWSMLPTDDLWPGIYLAPDMPLRDSLGNPIQQYKNTTITNPLLWLRNSYTSVIATYIVNIQLNYILVHKKSHELVIKLNAGFNTQSNKETSKQTIASQDPRLSPTGTFVTDTNRFEGATIEPQAEYRFNIGRLKTTVLTGASFLKQFNAYSMLTASGYTNDNQLQVLSAAGSTQADHDKAQYRYSALFGSVNLNLDEKFIVNFTGRRDASSRFGPDNRAGNFGSVGIAWIFCADTSGWDHPAWLSFGKVRGSYGITGNDQIGDYMFAAIWLMQPANRAYAGIIGLSPSRLSNTSFAWPRTQKMDLSAEFAFLKKYKLLVAAYMNRSYNQLVSYVLPGQTGFPQQDANNMQAMVVNTGLELTASFLLISKKYLQLTCSALLTLPKNILKDFPNLAASNYANTLVVGESLTTQRAYQHTDPDPITGIAGVVDRNKDGKITTAGDYTISGNTDPVLYGGFSTTLTYKCWEFDFFWEGRKQKGPGQLANAYNTLPPGWLDDRLYGNQPSMVLNRWQKKGDVSNIQKLTTNSGTQPGMVINDLKKSDLQLTDASFLRLKTVTLSMQLPGSWLKKMHLGGGKIYVEGQNLLTITHFKGADPVTQNFNAIAPLKTISFGLQINFNVKKS